MVSECGVGVYVMWECMWCGSVCGVGVYVVWECMWCGSVFAKVKKYTILVCK